MRLSEAEAFVRQHRETWMPDAKGYQTTVINFGHALRILGDMEVEHIRTIHFAQLVQALKEEGRNTATVNRIQSALSCVLRTLVRFELLDRAPSYNRLRESRGRTKLYSEEQLLALLVACSKLPEDAEVVTDIVTMASKTGARQGELLKLTWGHVDLQDSVLYLMDTKTHDNRRLPILGEVKEMLQRRYEDRIDDGKVFPISKDSLLRRIRKAQAMAGITDKDLCFHTLRHQAATELFARGAELPVVKEILGHRQVATTLRYAHATKEGIEKALKSL